MESSNDGVREHPQVHPHTHIPLQESLESDAEVYAPDEKQGANPEGNTQAEHQNAVAPGYEEHNEPVDSGSCEEDDEEPPIKRPRRNAPRAHPSETHEEEDATSSDPPQALNPGTLSPGIAMKQPRNATAPRTLHLQTASVQPAPPQPIGSGSERLKIKKHGSGSNYFETMDTDSDYTSSDRSSKAAPTSSNVLPGASDLLEVCNALHQECQLIRRLLAQIRAQYTRTNGE